MLRVWGLSGALVASFGEDELEVIRLEGERLPPVFAAVTHRRV